MEQIEFEPKPGEWEIKGFPDAVKVIKLSGDRASQLAHAALHQADLLFAKQCLEKINEVSKDQHFLGNVFFESAVVTYQRCFKSGVRDRLDPKLVYDNDAGALETYRDFESLRDKHIAHDVNAYSDCLTGAILNKRDASFKIAKIVTISVSAVTLNQANWSNLYRLVSLALKWIETKYDRLCNELTNELE